MRTGIFHWENGIWNGIWTSNRLGDWNFGQNFGLENGIYTPTAIFASSSNYSIIFMSALQTGYQFNGGESLDTSDLLSFLLCCFTFNAGKMPSRRRSGKNAPILSHEFVITNHGDIVSCVCMVFMIGLMFQVRLTQFFAKDRFCRHIEYIVSLPFYINIPNSFDLLVLFSRQRPKQPLCLSPLNII